MKKCFFLFFFALLLFYPKLSLSLAANGLYLWLNCMVPVLFPFMLLSGIMIRQRLTEEFAGFLHPVTGKLFACSKNGTYCIIIGLLCGFPMGAKTVAELYAENALSKREAELLLSFCNVLGPVYYISFLLPATGLFQKEKLFFLLLGMYGIPFLYGIFLRLTGFLLPKESICAPCHSFSTEKTENIFISLDYAIQSAIAGITTLGGYMILFNVLNLFPQVFLQIFPRVKTLPYMENFSALCSCLLEITGGVSAIGTSAPLFVLTLLPLGGLSCIAQTQNMLKNTDLSLNHYLIHKGIQTVLTAGYYFFLFRFW